MTDDALDVLRWYAEKAEAIKRYGEHKQPKDQAMLAVVTELMLDGGSRARALLAAQEPPGFYIDRSVPPIVLPPGGPLPANHADDGVRFCPHCNPCTHDGGEKCRAPERAAQEPRPEPVAWAVATPSGDIWHLAKAAGWQVDAVMTAAEDEHSLDYIADEYADAAPSPAQQTMAAECESTDRNETGTTRAARGPSAKAEHDEPVAQSVATPTVEVDERRLQELLTNTGLANWQQDAILIAIRTAWRESALAERQRAADDALERSFLKWCVDRAEAYFDPDAFGITGVPGRYAQFAEAVEAARPVFNAMSAQGDA